jgi:hypothetical protein
MLTPSAACISRPDENVEITAKMSLLSTKELGSNTRFQALLKEGCRLELGLAKLTIHPGMDFKQGPRRAP